MKSLTELYEFATVHTFDEVAAVLKKHIDDGQPESFLPSVTSRRMCAVASAGLERQPLEMALPFAASVHGLDLYAKMWGL